MNYSLLVSFFITSQCLWSIFASDPSLINESIDQVFEVLNVVESVEDNHRSPLPKFELKIHEAGTPITLQKDGDVDNDVCEILSECFTVKSVVRDPINFPGNPLARCHKTLRRILNAYDSGFFYEDSRIVGFVSAAIHTGDRDFDSMNVYNVCVRKGERGKGVAKAMIPRFIDSLRTRIIAKDHPEVVKPLFVGLEVDFETESAVSAFALYSKLGFNRLWQPCALLDRQRLLETRLINPEAKGPQIFTHLCMVMLWAADDFVSIGRDISAAVKRGLEKYPKIEVKRAN